MCVIEPHMQGKPETSLTTDTLETRIALIKLDIFNFNNFCLH